MLFTKKTDLEWEAISKAILLQGSNPYLSEFGHRLETLPRPT